MAAAIGRMHLLMAKNINLLRSAVNLLTKQAKANPIFGPVHQASTVPAYARIPRQPIHPAAFLKQSRRWLSTKTAEAARRLGSSSVNAGSYTTKARFSTSRSAAAIGRSSNRAPFASTLRPNLTGGAIPRTQGGYSLGGGRRYFSHSPAPAAEVVQNVSQAMRAFMLGGKQLQYDGIDARTGEKRFKTVSATQAKATQNLTKLPRATPGSFIDFNVNPTITAMGPVSLSSVAGFQSDKEHGMETLHSEGLLDILSTDFSRALNELMMTMSDLRSLSALGDLPISYQHNKLRVHFPGVDAETVESLATELGIKRGVVGQDDEFDDFVGTEIALLFPFASSSGAPSTTSLQQTIYPQQTHAQPWRHSSASSVTLSDTGLAYEDLDQYSLPSNEYESIPETTASQSLVYHSTSSPRGAASSGNRAEQPLEYQDFEGIYRFIELCDHARR